MDGMDIEPMGKLIKSSSSILVPLLVSWPPLLSIPYPVLAMYGYHASGRQLSFSYTQAEQSRSSGAQGLSCCTAAI
jgi:hypothetical protein